MNPQVLLQGLVKNGGWIKFFGICLVVFGALVCLGILTIPYGVLMIWSGVLAYKSSRLLEEVQLSDAVEDARAAIEKIALYFKVALVIAVIDSVFMLISILTENQLSIGDIPMYVEILGGSDPTSI